MKILKKNDEILLNHEILKLLKIPSNLKNSENFQDFRTMTHLTLKYLNSEYLPITGNTEDGVKRCYQALVGEFKTLMKFEVLMIINTRPTCLVELKILIEDANARFQSAELLKMIEILDSCIPYKKPIIDE